MINRADVEKLRSMHAQGSAVLSLYLPVPLDPARLRGLAAEAGDLMGDVSANGPDSVSNAGVSPLTVGVPGAGTNCGSPGGFSAWG